MRPRNAPVRTRAAIPDHAGHRASAAWSAVRTHRRKGGRDRRHDEHAAAGPGQADPVLIFAEPRRHGLGAADDRRGRLPRARTAWRHRTRRRSSQAQPIDSRHARSSRPSRGPACRDGVTTSPARARCGSSRPAAGSSRWSTATSTPLPTARTSTHRRRRDRNGDAPSCVLRGQPRSRGVQHRRPVPVRARLPAAR